VLAGGAGTRLRPVISDLPKPLAMVCGRPFIEYLICQVAAAGITRATLLTGYMSELLRETIGDMSHGVELEYSAESEPRGTGGALKLAEPLLAGDAWLLLNGDSLLDVSLNELVERHVAGSFATLALTRVEDARRYGGVTTADDGGVTAFREKSDATEAYGAWVNAGVYVLERAVLKLIDSDRPVSFESEVLPALIGRGLRAERLDGYFIDIGIPDDYRRAQQECSVFERLASAVPR
jgi:NDP-sugar pyrophosphorylase family protein